MNNELSGYDSVTGPGGAHFLHPSSPVPPVTAANCLTRCAKSEIEHRASVQKNLYE